MQPRQLGTTSLQVTAVAMGCWPIAGITSVDVIEEESRKTLRAAFENGITTFDTAYAYGYEGESERLIAAELGSVRDEIVICTKGGIEWDAHKDRLIDGRPETLKRQCEESLRRLKTDRADLYYLHAPDPNTSLEDSAKALLDLKEQGKILSVGVSNFSVDQLKTFHQVCPITAFQPHYNMLQREIEEDSLPWCIQHNVSALVYWPLMKGLLAGKLKRDHLFDPKDGRQKYPMFQGEEWQKNQDFLDELREIARDLDRSVADIVINWTIHREGITSALCGAKRPSQIEQSAQAMTWKLTEEELNRIDQAIERRGPIVSRSAV